MVTVRITETYDMKTTVGKLGIIGIHTPNGTQIQRLYPGLAKNHKYIRFRKCDVVGACASVLPADPLQVGVSAGAVAPEDMFNPILYKAVTNDSFDTLVSRIYDSVNSTQVNQHGSVNEQELDVSDADAFRVYYGLLAENGKFRKSLPQSGFRIKNLIPICHTLISQYGNLKKPGVAMADSTTVPSYPVGVPDNLGQVPFSNPQGSAMDTAQVITGQVFRGRSVKMPRMPLHTEQEALTATTSVSLPKTFVACMILPPARLHEFYYRMRVTWTISFEKIVSTNEYTPAGTIATTGGSSYARDYTFPSAKMALPGETDIVDTDGVECNKIMES